MDNNVFTVKNLSFAYGRQQVLKNLDLELHEGKIQRLRQEHSFQPDDQKPETGRR